MNRVSHAVLALTALIALTLGAAVLVQAQEGQAKEPVRFVKSVRGTANVEYTQPQTKVDHAKGLVTTVVKVKNVSDLAIIRLTVEEFWWDKAGNPVTGGKDWCKKPLMAGEVYTFTITTPRDPKMFRNNYKFSHANGDVKPKIVKTIE